MELIERSFVVSPLAGDKVNDRMWRAWERYMHLASMCDNLASPAELEECLEEEARSEAAAYVEEMISARALIWNEGTAASATMNDCLDRYYLWLNAFTRVVAQLESEGALVAVDSFDEETRFMIENKIAAAMTLKGRGQHERAQAVMDSMVDVVTEDVVKATLGAELGYENQQVETWEDIDDTIMLSSQQAPLTTLQGEVDQLNGRLDEVFALMTRWEIAINAERR